MSGVMATVAAGVVMGGWGRAKISPSVAGYLEHFWEYLAYVSNALIFLLVGLRVHLPSLLDSLALLSVVLIAMLISRMVVIFGFVPVVGKLPNSQPISKAYQAVMYWGGLRGAIALAIVLHLPENFAYAETFLVLVMGVVLFTLLVQGLTIGRLVRYLGLDKPPLSDRLARADGVLAANRRAQERIPELQAGGFFSARIATMVQERYKESIKKIVEEIEILRGGELDSKEEFRLLFLKTLALEKTMYYEMFSKGHLSESAYRDLDYSTNLQIESIRDSGKIPESTLYSLREKRFENIFSRVTDVAPVLSALMESIRSRNIAKDYEKAWGRHEGSNKALSELEEIVKTESVRPEVTEQVRTLYQSWNKASSERINITTEQFPEFVSSMQEKLAARLAVHAKREAIDEKARAGTIPAGVAEIMQEEIAEELRDLRGREVGKLRLEPTELLRKVPFFREMPPEEFGGIANKLRQRTFPSGQAIIKQGEKGESLFLIARGVVRVSLKKDSVDKDLATLMAGDFFGEMALLHKEPRTATCRAVTPCALYELKHDDFDELRTKYPVIQKALAEADRVRAATL